MVFIETMVIITLILGTIAFIVVRGLSYAEQRDQRDADLRSALASRDYKRLDDWLVLHSDHASEKLKKHVALRRDELYIESSERKQ